MIRVIIVAEINLVKGQIRADGDFKDDILRGSVDNNILSGNGGNDQIWVVVAVMTLLLVAMVQTGCGGTKMIVMMS